MLSSIFFSINAGPGRNYFGDFAKRLRIRSARRSIRETLLRMDDHQLRDLGIARHNILSGDF